MSCFSLAVSSQAYLLTLRARAEMGATWLLMASLLPAGSVKANFGFTQPPSGRGFCPARPCLPTWPPKVDRNCSSVLLQALFNIECVQWPGDILNSHHTTGHWPRLCHLVTRQGPFGNSWKQEHREYDPSSLPLPELIPANLPRTLLPVHEGKLY